MACKVERYGENGVELPKDKVPGTAKTIVFSCDAAGCDVVADDMKIATAGSLRHMGWWAAGGKHFCPEHFAQGGEHQW